MLKKSQDVLYKMYYIKSYKLPFTVPEATTGPPLRSGSGAGRRCAAACAGRSRPPPGSDPLFLANATGKQ